ncbi:MAG TPA: hypothetical protein VIX80_10085 [Candidatus Kapabacteria bacterium]
MKKIQSILFIAFLSIGAFIGCGDDPVTPEATGTVNVSSQLTSASVSSTSTKGRSVTAAYLCDSVVISRMRFVFSDMKMHFDKDDSTEDHGKVKTGPFIMEYIPGTVKLITTSEIPVGTYDKIKYEIHKLDDSKDTAAINDPAFADFITGGRFTYIIEGLIYNSNSASAFTFKSSKNENLELKFDVPVTISEGVAAPITLQLDPSTIFKQGAKPFDPRYEENRNDFEKMVKDAFHALKK